MSKHRSTTWSRGYGWGRRVLTQHHGALSLTVALVAAYKYMW